MVERVNLPRSGLLEQLNSAEWIHAVKTKIEKNNILITAKVTFPPDQTKHYYPGQIKLQGIEPGKYNLFYLDPDGNRHKIKIIVLK